MRIPINGGSPERLFDIEATFPPIFEDLLCSRAPAKVCVVLGENAGRTHFTITGFDPLTGEHKLLRTGAKGSGLARYVESLSPDGKTFALARSGEPQTHIRLLSLTGGTDREITAKDCPNTGGLSWSADGKGFYCGSLSSRGGILSYLDLQGNSQVLWRQTASAIGLSAMYAIPSPDGHYLAIYVGQSTSNVWMLEDF
jgi:Tol biopolymer transport system component